MIRRVLSTANTPSENPLTRSGVGLRSTAYLFLRIEAELDHWHVTYQDERVLGSVQQKLVASGCRSER